MTYLKTQTDRAFILPAALLLLVISCSALSLAAYNSGCIAMAANQRELDLKLHWSAAALQKVILPAANDIFNERNNKNSNTAATENQELDMLPGYFYGESSLNNIEFQWVLRDEQAMANINSLKNARDTRDLLEAVRKLTELDISSEKQTAELILPFKKTEIKTFDELFDYGNLPDRLFSVDKKPSGAAMRLSCWGDGKLNLLRADRKTLETVLAGKMDLNTIVTLINLRQGPELFATDQNDDTDQDNTRETISLNELLKILELDEDQQNFLKNLTCTESKTFSLTLQLQNEAKSWRRMYVLDRSGEQDAAAATKNSQQSQDKKTEQVYQW